jgi:parvulin-like peptidyl-prolyl isomerase
MRWILGLLLVSGVAAADIKGTPTLPGEKKVIHVERVVAIINDAIIMRSELDARLLPVMSEVQSIADPKERKRRFDKLTSQVLDEMVSEELIVQAAEAAKIEVEPSEVQAALDEIRQQNNLDEAGLAKALAAQGYTLANYKADLRRQLLRLRAVNQLVAPKVTVTDEDIRARYDQMQRRSDAVSAVQLAQMLFKLPDHPTQQQIADARAKATAALVRVKAGEDFGKVAGEVSEDDSTKANGGQLGWFERGVLPADLEQVVFSMEKGDVRGPIQGAQGFQVFNLTDIKKSEIKPYAEMKEQLSREIRRHEMDKATATWIDELRKKAYIEIKL